MAQKNNIRKNDEHQTSRTLWYLYCLFLGLSLIILGRIVYLQLLWDPQEETDKLSYFQPKNYAHEIEPERGAIMDCKGKLLAYSTHLYNIHMD